MADIDSKVLAAVESALKDNPSATVDELFNLAQKVNGSIADLTKRQFHARYPLQVKRKLSPPKPRKARRSRSGTRKGSAGPDANGVREAVRASFLKFASDLAGAEVRKEVVRVVAGVDRYVDEVLKATGR